MKYSGDHLESPDEGDSDMEEEAEISLAVEVHKDVKNMYTPRHCIPGKGAYNPCNKYVSDIYTKHQVFPMKSYVLKHIHVHFLELKTYEYQLYCSLAAFLYVFICIFFLS